jgi:hypothetical protein
VSVQELKREAYESERYETNEDYLINETYFFSNLDKALPIIALLVKLPPHCLLSGQISGPVWRSLNINPRGTSNGISTLQNEKRGSTHP